ncbi:MAG: sulfatase [Planctomycetota bacterium]
MIVPLAVLAQVLLGQQTSDSSRTNVLLYLIDTLRADHLQPWGYQRNTSATIRQVAESGVLFKRCFSQGPWTKPSVNSIHTSLYPSVSNVRQIFDRMPTARTTLAEALKDAGYQTAAFSANPIFGMLSNLRQGFETFCEATEVIKNGDPIHFASGSSRELNKKVLPWLRQRDRTRPFFVCIHSVDPHEEYAPESPFGELWVKPAERQQFETSWTKLKNLHPYFPALRTTREEARAHAVDPEWFSAVAQGLYDGDIAFNDDQLARVLETLESEGDLEHTLIVITADHGEEFFDHDGTSHGFSLYNELLNVPLIFSLPDRIREGETVTEPVASIDIAPTILALVGAAPLPEAQGQSMAAFLLGEKDEPPHGPIFAENYDTPEGSGLGSMSMGCTSMVISGRHKLIFTGSAPSTTNPPKYQLFDLADDFHETKNLAAAQPARVAALEKILLEWSADNLKRANAGESVAREKVDPAILERLRELGYIK